MSVTIDGDSALVAFKAELLKSLTSEQREKILGDALQQVLKLGDRYSSDRFGGDVMRLAISDAVVAVVKEVLARPESQAKLREAAEGVVTGVMGKLSENLVRDIEKTVRGY